MIIIKYSRVNCISNHYFLQEKMGGKAGQWSVTIWTGEIPGLVTSPSISKTVLYSFLMIINPLLLP